MCSRTAFGIRRYSLKRATVKGAPQGEKGSTNDGDLDAEKGEERCYEQRYPQSRITS